MNLLEEIKERVRMKDVLEMYGYTPARGTNIYKCMYHDDKNPSANIIKSCDRFHCFSCQVTKDIVDFVQDQEQCDFATALKIIDAKFHLGLCHSLTAEERKRMQIEFELRKQRKEREEFWKQTEKTILDKIASRIRYWETIEEETTPTKTIAMSGNWENENIYFKALKERQRLTDLYDVICGFEREPQQYRQYLAHKKLLMRHIIKGKIQI